MEDHLIPVNGLIALLRGDGLWPGALDEQGFRLHRLEPPVSTSEGDLRADAIIYRSSPGVILLCECKSGNNVKLTQANRYLAVDRVDLERRQLVPEELAGDDEITIGMLMVGTEECRPRLTIGLGKLESHVPLLTVGDGTARLTLEEAVPGLQAFELTHPGGLPPARIPVDHQSPEGELAEHVVVQIFSAVARSEEELPVEDIARNILAEWPVVSHDIKRQFMGRVESVARALARDRLRRWVRFEPRQQQDRQGRIVIVASPADRDPRGTSQAWQATQRSAGKALRRQKTEESDPQLSLDELANWGGLAKE